MKQYLVTFVEHNTSKDTYKIKSAVQSGTSKADVCTLIISTTTKDKQRHVLFIQKVSPTQEAAIDKVLYS